MSLQKELLELKFTTYGLSKVPNHKLWWINSIYDKKRLNKTQELWFLTRDVLKAEAVGFTYASLFKDKYRPLFVFSVKDVQHLQYISIF